jgi:epoxyqueuosine reductase
MIGPQVEKILNCHLIPSYDYIYGFADLHGLLAAKFNGFSYGISIGMRLNDDILDRVKDGPTREYLNHYTEINHHLLAISEKIAFNLNDIGINAYVIKPTVTATPAAFDLGMPTLRYDISHKMVATRAGLGWIGKTDLFISKKFGARLRLTSILIDRKITPKSKPIDKSRCGNCSICVEKCPAQAATDQLWDINTDRDLFFDAFKCREKCSEFGRTHLKTDKRICGICVAVCPIGRENNPENI